MMDIGDLGLAQKDGGLPTMVTAGRAPGESGVSVVSVRFQGAAHFSATPRQHLVWFLASPGVRFHCRIAGRSLQHDLPVGSLAVCPAGADSAADTEDSVDALLVAVDPRQLALAAAA